ncbi:MULTISPECIES: DotH/IcmK family type IV secretion protein [unclassified Thioalkalivibrio]|uniref:DotH/IcmK family type IV secretion protein n=1 Tax=unclassified Thioalkalivibrio TaxID=2621013 RepID=UPI000364E499|nr:MULTISPECIES: DotH/IcmK family type IV secretion protein [unclassified Thioalkalivibrio]
MTKPNRLEPLRFAILAAVLGLGVSGGAIAEEQGSTLKAAPGSMDPVDPDVLDAMRPPPLPVPAFQGAASGVLDLTPDEIRVFRSLVEQVQRASSSEIRPVKPKISTTRIDTDPSAPPPELYLRVGYDTSVAFLDAAGNPWPVRPVSIGDSEAYSVQQADENVIVLHATSAFRPSNFTVMLEGRSSPLMIHLVNGEETVDYLRTMTMPELTPGAMRERLKAGQPTDVPTINDPSLTSFLDGVPPSDAQVIPVLDAQVQAWKYRNRMVVRTRLDLLSHADSILHGRDGWRVYELKDILPSLVMSQGGQSRTVQFVLDDIDFDDYVDRRRSAR